MEVKNRYMRNYLCRIIFYTETFKCPSDQYCVYNCSEAIRKRIGKTLRFSKLLTCCVIKFGQLIVS